MGTYYLAACEELREYFDPMDFGLSNKWHSVVEGDAAKVLSYAVMTRWSGKDVRWVADEDGSDLYFAIRGAEWALKGACPWRNVSEELKTDLGPDEVAEPPFPRPICGMTLDEMRRALEHISGECRATLPELSGADAELVGSLLEAIAKNAEEAHAMVMALVEGPTKKDCDLQMRLLRAARKS